MSGNLFALTFVIAALYGVYNFSIKAGSEGIHQMIAALILQVVAAVMGGSALVFLCLRGTAFSASTRGVSYAVLAGAAVGVAEILSFYVYSKGLTVSIGTPIIVGGTVLVGALLGIIFLEESLKLQQWIGLLLMVIAVVLLTWK